MARLKKKKKNSYELMKVNLSTQEKIQPMFTILLELSDNQVEEGRGDTAENKNYNDTSADLQHPLHLDWLQLPHACLPVLCLKLLMLEVGYPPYHFLLAHGFPQVEVLTPLPHL